MAARKKKPLLSWANIYDLWPPDVRIRLEEDLEWAQEHGWLTVPEWAALHGRHRSRAALVVQRLEEAHVVLGGGRATGGDRLATIRGWMIRPGTPWPEPKRSGRPKKS